MQKKHIVNRILVSLITAFSFIAMSLSGIAAFIVPQGRVAFWTNWSFLGLSKSDWGNIHITTSVLFLIAGIWHTWYNWNSLLQYFRQIPGRVSASGRDIAIALFITVFFTVGAVSKTFPLNYILTFNSWIKDSWVKTAADEPPFGHAELLSLKGFCKKMSIQVEEALKTLRDQGISVMDANSTVEQIARANKLTPAQIYEKIKHLENKEDNNQQPVAAAMSNPNANSSQLSQQVKTELNLKPSQVSKIAAKVAPVVTYTADTVIEKFEGKGIGKKKFAAICAELQLDCNQITKKLAAKKITIGNDETLKDAAARQSIAPIEFLTTILEGEPMK